MNSKAVTLSLAMAVLAVLLVESYVSTIEDSARKRFGTERLVVVAKKDISEMKTLDETSIELKPVPEVFVQPSAIAFEGKANDPVIARFTKGLVGRVALVPIRKGEQITRNKITEPNIRTGLSPRITPGLRAVTIPVNEISGVGKLVKPGDRVDLIAVIKDKTSKDQSKISRIMLQDVSVLAVGRFVSGNLPRLVLSSGRNSNERVRNLQTFDGFLSVTIEVRPNEAQMLSLLVLDRETKLMLALRNSDDSDRVPSSTISTDEFTGVSPDKEPVRRNAPRRLR